MEIDDLKGLIELLKDTDITELQIEKDGSKVKIRREKRLSSIELSRPAAAHEKPAAETAEDAQRLITVTSPIVGTFYRSSSPEGESFVQVGSIVKKGQVLCIIEAMKLMNEIESEVEGVIVRILVENGHSVEYGEPLFLIEPVI
ncbi:MAG: acetyl-CoA carboxylase, biotin carboxyl carrier protein [Nitrospirae bacterium CG_4_10_14_3_um_filter_44_29]|nr:acetyl-CoA carboxylase biotin carboxyl carrier protein [Nitrospirota bacterium]OIO29950.1 MAG: acetyl-CoA carboxylase, biotin carboxyl carrier protein [Nitrospirae bacterium CG1_02_44_142]PIP69535.1 MAG: acetyl-CoA carboxylase, biotin carboxyl carrier protein [Nitrospirae bacterium CG22_combo_CG10-13_8_21_14_all_44_11]PIV41141.1 MAG: acetyl-CoA carboxylase, biotin carboxyl carrier protein [Nitrospirae bacterium CG02_land_8_20_14_3_00_44_33]PIV66561.1 MAG: acetyl-CoA carboxylase, biotin carbo